MKPRSNQILLFASSPLVAVIGSFGCDSDEPCPGVAQGTSYRVEVVGESKAAQPEGCSAAWGFAEGLTFTATANKIVPSATCSVGVPELSGVPGWSFTLGPTEPLNDGFMRGNYEGTFEDCTASLDMSLDAGGGRRCFTSSGASSADCLLLFNFRSGGGRGCPANCTAWLSVNVTR